MSDTVKRPYAQMYSVACRLVDRLRSACSRIEIAGSLRRHSDLVGDIEIVLIPLPLTDLFGAPTGQTEVDILLATWPVTITKNGQRYKKFSFLGKQGGYYSVDLFLQPDPATWGINMMIRTGSATFSKLMVTQRSLGGFAPDQYSVKDARVWQNGAPCATPEENDVFRLWGLDFISPEERSGDLFGTQSHRVRHTAL